MSQYRRIASALARRSFAPAGALAAETGAELQVLVEELVEAEDAEWLLEDGKAQRRLENLLRNLEAVLLGYQSRGMTPPLEPTATVTFFRFAVRDDGREDQRVRDLRARLRLHERMLECLRSLDPADFEQLCGRVLREAGCDAVHVTRSSQDLGSDFFGRSPAVVGTDLPPGIGARLRVLRDVFLLLFGQAKRYAEYNTIGLDTVKLVEGTWHDIVRRKQAGTLPQHLDRGLAEIGWQPGDAVRFMFVTTSSYTGPARTWATTAGMITLDGDQLAQLLLETAVGVERTPQGHWHTHAALVAQACAPPTK